MRLVGIYIEQEELNGTMIIHYPVYGGSMRQVEFHMDHIGTIRGQNKKSHGKKIIEYG